MEKACMRKYEQSKHRGVCMPLTSKPTTNCGRGTVGRLWVGRRGGGQEEKKKVDEGVKFLMCIFHSVGRVADVWAKAKLVQSYAKV